MNTNERAHLRLLLDHRASELRTTAAKQNKAMHRDHSSKGLLSSGATIRAALRIAEELAEQFVSDAFNDAASVAKQPDAFRMAFTDVTIIMRDLKVHVDSAVRLVARGAVAENIRGETERLFLELQQRTYRLAEIRRIEFDPPAESKSTASAPSPPLEPPKNKGGAPLAAHWDEMWADIAVQLWNGDLQPKRQKDISDAMFAWLVARDLDAGNTAVTARARALWTKLEPALRG